MSQLNTTISLYLYIYYGCMVIHSRESHRLDKTKREWRLDYLSESPNTWRLIWSQRFDCWIWLQQYVCTVSIATMRLQRGHRTNLIGTAWLQQFACKRFDCKHASAIIIFVPSYVSPIAHEIARTYCLGSTLANMFLILTTRKSSTGVGGWQIGVLLIGV